MNCAIHSTLMFKDPYTGIFVCKECNADPFLEAKEKRRKKRLAAGEPEELNFNEK